MKKKNKKQRGSLQRLSEAYYTPDQPSAYGGINRLQKYTKLKRTAVKNWLSYQDSYTLHKPVRKNFQRRRVIVGGIDHQWQADLIDIQRLKKYNERYSYLLCVIDVFSKYAWVVPLKNKTGTTLVQAFENIFKQGRKPLKLQTDKGTEFLNRTFQKFLQENNVRFFTTQNEDIKASIVERFNRTLKEKLWRYFTKKNTLRFLETLPHLVKGYNHSYHRSIKKRPVDVDTENQEDVWQTLYKEPLKQTKVVDPLKIGDRVRISKARRVFKKSYLPSWTEELFTISRVNQTTPITYVLKDDNNEELLGSFYHQEIQKVGDKDIFRIETVLKQRTGPKRTKEFLVKWQGYPSSFNSWIPQTAFQQYPTY